MPILQALVRYSITALFLGLCLQLITGQDEDVDNRKPLIVQISPIPQAKANETREIRCNVSTQLRESMAVRLYIVTSQKTDCLNFFEQEACIVPGDAPRNFYWNICSKRSVLVACVAEVTNEREICDGSITVVPTANSRSHAFTYFRVK